MRLRFSNNRIALLNKVYKVITSHLTLYLDKTKTMGCGASSQSKACADNEFVSAKASFPSEEVSGEDVKIGMGTADKQFDTIKSFNWTFGGTGSVKIGKVQDVTLNKTPKIQLEIEVWSNFSQTSTDVLKRSEITLCHLFQECTGVFKCDNLANGNVSIKKANIVYMHDTCESKVKIDQCNCLIILKDGNSTEYTVGKVKR